MGRWSLGEKASFSKVAIVCMGRSRGDLALEV